MRHGAETATARVPATTPQAHTASNRADLRPFTGGTLRTRSIAPGTKKAKTAPNRICIDV
ncbi:hypothetical protein [Streptomyces sp. RKAG290]|uniref:hypothetical protein n=1 Tax=Streptomyces sp. RKAG290 TaxID=2888348 RepID=UPI0035A92185